MRERDFHSFEKGFKYQLCHRNVVVEIAVAVVFLLIQSMKYAARLQSKKKISLVTFAVLIIATICITYGATKRGKMRRQDEDIKHGKYSTI
jgi:hypothetical protein